MAAKNRIERYLHCRRCITEKSANQTPSEYARLEVGLTADGIQVWCRRHRMEVGAFTPAQLEELLSTVPPCECCPGGRHTAAPEPEPAGEATSLPTHRKPPPEGD